MIKQGNDLENCPMALFLLEKMMSRKKINRRYSLRAFARDLELSPGRLSDILKGKYIPGDKIQDRIIKKLKLSDEESDRFRALVDQKKILSSHEFPSSVYRIREDELALIADWEHFAILTLVETDHFVSNDAWIAGRLNLSIERAHAALERLLRMNLLTMNDGAYTAVHENMVTSNEVPSPVLQESHRQNIQQALQSLKADPVTLRDISSISFRMDMASLPEAKIEIRKFRLRMAKLLSDLGENRTEVFNLNIQLVPITTPLDEAEKLPV